MVSASIVSAFALSKEEIISIDIVAPLILQLFHNIDRCYLFIQKYYATTENKVSRNTKTPKIQGIKSYCSEKHIQAKLPFTIP